MTITLAEATRRLIHGADVSILDEVDDKWIPSEQTAHQFLGNCTGSRLCIALNEFRFENVVEAVGTDPRTKNAAAVIATMLEKYPELRNGRFTTWCWTYAMYEGGAVHVVGLDVLRVMVKYGWRFSRNSAFLSIGLRSHYDDEGARMRMIVEHDLLRDVPRFDLLRYCFYNWSTYGPDVANWLVRHDERSAIEATTPTYWAKFQLDPDIAPSIAHFIARKEGLKVTSVLLCAEGGELTFAFYKIFKFLY